MIVFVLIIILAIEIFRNFTALDIYFRCDKVTSYIFYQKGYICERNTEFWFIFSDKLVAGEQRPSLYR